MTPLNTARDVAAKLEAARDVEFRAQMRLVEARAELVRLARLYQLALDEVGR